MPKTILVTGGAGFIGSHLVDRLVGAGHAVTVIDDLNDYYEPAIKHRNLMSFRNYPDVQIVEADIRSGVFDSLFSQKPYDAVFHLAARAGVRPSLSDPRLYYDVNVMGTINLLESMKNHGVNQLIFASSSSIYGNRKDGPFRETDNTDAQISPYGASKKAGELAIHSYAHLYGIKSTCLRFFTAFGPRNRPDLACYKFMDAIAKGKPIDQYGDGSTGRDYTYIDDVVFGVAACLDKDWPYEIINLGNSHPVKLTDMIVTIAAVVGKEPQINVLPMQPGDVEFTFADTTKAFKLLNWQPKTSFKDGIAKMWEWYKSSV